MFERFSTASRRVVVEAEAEARRLDHGFIGTEHLALALAGEAAAGSRANDLLIGSGIDADELREAVRATIGAGHPVAVQSMTATKTSDVAATVRQAICRTEAPISSMAGS